MRSNSSAAEQKKYKPQITETAAQLKIIIGIILMGLAICMYLLTKGKKRKERKKERKKYFKASISNHQA